MKKVRDVIADVLKINESEISNDSKLSELGADSLDKVEIMMGLEEEFDLDVSDEEAEKMNTVQDIIDYISDNT
jgi:acyl carrier protein